MQQALSRAGVRTIAGLEVLHHFHSKSVRVKTGFNPKAFESMKPGNTAAPSSNMPKVTHGGVSRQPVEHRRGLLARALRGNKGTSDTNLPTPQDFSGS